MKRILLLSLLLLPIVALAQYPTFSNKQKLGVQTTGDGLIFRGTTINNIPNYTPSNVNNAYFHLDTTNNKLYLYNNNAWQLVYPTPQFDTTTLNVYLKISDTTAMLLPYFRDSDTTSLNLINRFALKLNISDTATMLTPYMKKADTISLSNRINLKLNISDTTILSNRITTNANNIITINNKLATKLDTIYVKFKDVVTIIENKDTINIGSSLTDGYAINIIGDSVNIDTVILDNRYPDRDSTNELQDITFATTSGIVTISGGKVMNLDTLYNSLIDSVNLLIRDSIAAFTPLTEGYGINIIGDSINIDTNIIFTQSDTITLSNRINTKLDTIYINYQTNVDVVTNKDTINIIPLTEGFGINIIGDSINIDSAVILATQQKQIAYVKNMSGVTMYKGQAVYSSGSTGDNKLVQLASSNTEQASSKTFGIVETDSIPNGSHGYIITFGLLSGINTDNLNEGSSVYLSSTSGQLTSVKPIAPLHLVTIGVCIRKQQNNGSIFVKIQNGFEFDELHDVRLTNLVDKSSIYYNLSEKLWRDTTAALLVSDTASMLSKYVNTYSNQTGINGDKTFNNIVTIDSATVTGKLLVNTNISDAVKISSNTNSTNLELTNSNGTVSIKSSNNNMILQTNTTALVYLNGENNKVGILTMNPEQALEVAGTIRVDSLVNNLTPDKLVGANNANDLTDIKIGNGLSFSNDTLKVDDNIINSGDTATLLRQDFIPLTSNQVIWTQGNKKLLPYFTQVYRNGQLLKDVQYTISSDSIVTLEEGSYKLGDIITVIAIDNIVALAGSGSMITLQGDVTGNGTNSITTTIGVGKVTNSMLAGSISDTKLNTITTAGKISNSATTATSSNTNNAIVTRDNSGNFSAGIITASLNGNATTATNVAYSGLTGTVPTWNQNTTGNAATVTSVLPSNFASQTANTVLAAPNSSNGTPTFRSLVSSDIPNLNYLPLAGGTLTGGLTGTTGTFNTKLIAGNIGSSSGSPIFTAGLSGTETEFHILQGTGYEGSPTTLRLTNNNGSYYQNGLFLKSIMERGLDEYNGRIGIMGTDYMILNKDNRIGIFNTTPSTTFDVNGTFKASGNSLIGGTLGVTGETTLSNKIFVGNFTDNTPISGGNYNIRLESDNVSSIGFHDSGNTLGSIRFSAATGFVIGASDGTFGPHATTISGATTLSNTTSTTPNILLGKNTSTNVVANVTTVEQTGLMTRGVTTFISSNTISTFDVIHSLGVIPETIIITSNAINASSGIFYEIVAKTDTLFRVQGFNVSNGSPAINKTLSVNWLAIK